MSAKETELTRSGNSKRAPSPVDTGVNLRRLSERERNLRPAWISLKHKFQRAMRTLIARSHAKRIIAAATQDLNIAKVGAPTKNRSKFARCFKKTRAPVECLLHLVTLYLIWTVTLNCIWTYDSYDAVAVVERQLLQSESAYNHEMSEYMLVDSISSLDVWMTNTVSTLFRQDNTRPLLRYGKYQDKDSICTPTYRNISYPLENGGASTNYRVLRPLVDIVTARNNRPQSGATYMADGLLIRQVRGTMLSGELKELNEPKILPCSSSAQQPTTTNSDSNSSSTNSIQYRSNQYTDGSKMSGLYLDYPTNRGYDLFFPADMSLTEAQNKLTSALNCGFVDSHTRAIIATVTLTTFSELPDSKYHHVKNNEHIRGAFGGYVDVSLSIMFEIPQSGIIRGWHSFVVTDRLIELWGHRTEYYTILTLTILVIFRFFIYMLELIIGDDHDVVQKRVSKCMMVLKLLSVVLWFLGWIAYLKSFPSGEFEGISNGNIVRVNGRPATEDDTYFYCSLQGHLETNSGAGNKRWREQFLLFFGLFAIFQCWESIDYLSVFPKIMVPVRTITSATREVGIFLIVYVVLVLGITIGLHVLFGDVERFSTIGNTISTILLVTLDQLEIGDIFDGTQHHHRLKARMTLISMRLLLQVIFLNNFVAIVLVQYEIARSEKRIVSEQSHKRFLRMGVVITRCMETTFQQCWNCCCVSCCGKEKITEQQSQIWLTPKFRRWYHAVRTEHQKAVVPLRHDTEVIVKEMHKLFKMVRGVSENQEKTRNTVNQLIDYTLRLEKKMKQMNNEIAHLGKHVGHFEEVSTSSDEEN
jgi:hypothetical protein